MTKQIIIDCDPGVDDCVALMLALASPDDLDVQAITTVAGNVPVETCTQNACGMATLAGRPDIPVYQGCPRPMVMAPVFADHVHGKSGLGDAILPVPACTPQSTHAVDYLVTRLMASAPDSVTLVMTGPLTNLGVALVKAPAITHAIKEIVIMGGARSAGGNVTASAEFNIYADPHGAHVVFECGAPITLIGLDATLQFRCTPERMDALKASGRRACTLTHTMVSHVNRVYGALYGSEGAALHDPCTIGYLLAPELFTAQPARVQISTDNGLTRGHTAVDIYLNDGTKPNARWVTGVDDARFFDLLISRISAL